MPKTLAQNGALWVGIALLCACSMGAQTIKQDQSQASAQAWQLLTLQNIEHHFPEMDRALKNNVKFLSFIHTYGLPEYLFRPNANTIELAYPIDNTLVTLNLKRADTDISIQYTAISQASADKNQYKPKKIVNTNPDWSWLSEDTRGYINLNTPPPQSSFGRYFALIIANSDYLYWNNLITPKSDAKQIADILSNQYGFIVSTQFNVTRFELISLLQQYRYNLQPSDNLLIYYAGHGNIDSDTERGFWIPTDSHTSNPSNWVANDDISNALKAMRANHVLVVSDSCYSGTLTRSGTPYSTSNKRYAERVHNKKSRTVFASGGIEPVQDSGGNGLSVFARAFTNTLLDREGVFSIQKLALDVKKRVALNADQTPVYSDIRNTGHELNGDFVFANQ